MSLSYPNGTQILNKDVNVSNTKDMEEHLSLLNEISVYLLFRILPTTQYTLTLPDTILYISL